MTALLPCPFCGGEADYLPDRLIAPNAEPPVFCDGCHASALNAAAWNRRAPNGKKEFDSGAWDAFNQVLYWINTLDTQTIDKKTLYAAVMEMRPSAPSAAFAAGAEAMRERAAREVDCGCPGRETLLNVTANGTSQTNSALRWTACGRDPCGALDATAIRALPLPAAPEDAP